MASETRVMNVRTGLSPRGAKLAKCTQLSRRVYARGRRDGCENRGARMNVTRRAMGVRAEWQKTGEKRLIQADICRRRAHRRGKATGLCAIWGINPR